MRDWLVQDVKLAVGGEWYRRPNDADGREASESNRALPVQFGTISTDTRSLMQGDIYFALKGANFDGADFLQAAQESGAAAIVTHRVPDSFDPTVPVIVVEDSLRAYGRLARAHRDASRAVVVGITGTNGKTTTREITAHLLRSRFQVLQNKANENNRVGVPKTLLRLTDHHDFAVMEMGTSEPGEIAALSKIVGHQCAVLTSISVGHLNGLSSLDGIIEEKSAILSALKRDGIAIVNYDNPACVKAAERANCRIVSFGTDRRCEIRATKIRANRFGTEFVLNGKDKFRLPLHGVHNVSNALAAIAVGWVSGVEITAMQHAMRRLQPVERRLEYRDVGGVGILDDSYNANPASTCAALKTLGMFPAQGQRIAVLGDMLELGARSEGLHREVAFQSVEHDVDLVVAVGSDMQALGDVYEQHFYKQGRGTVWRFANSEQAAVEVAAEVRDGDVVLVKGSNGLKMGRVCQAIRDRFGASVRKPLRPTLREMPVGDPLPESIEKKVA